MHTCRCYCASIAIALILVIIVGIIAIYYYLFHGEHKSYVTKIDQMRLLNSTYLPNYYNLTKLTIDKYNESASILNFEGEIFIDLDESVYLQMDMYHSKPNTIEYDQWSIHLPNMTICTYNRLYYKHFMMERLKDISNFPQFGPDDSTCIKKGKYWIKDYIIKTTYSMPYLPLGTFKFEYIFNRFDVRVLFEVTFKIELFTRKPKIVPFWL